MKNKNIFVVLEGGDGSGKKTQTELLIRALRHQKMKVMMFDFPRYEESLFGVLIGEALAGKHGDFIACDPYLASLPFTLDRVLAKGALDRALKNGWVVANRYTPSNIAYQAAKIKNRNERTRYIEFLEQVEYGELKLPKPDLVVYLYVPAATARELVSRKEKRTYIPKGERDQYEENQSYQGRVLDVYRSQAKSDPDWQIINCAPKGELLSPEEIHILVLNVVVKNVS